MLEDALVISFIIVLIIYFFSNNTLSLFETFMMISTMNTKSGTKRIFPYFTKCTITLDPQKQMKSFKEQQIEQLFHFDMVPNTYTFWKKFLSKIIVFWLYHFLLRL